MFIRRSRTRPTTEQLAELEQTWIIDGDPSYPVTGIGSGTLLLVGEFEDGDFNTPTEVYGESDERSKFGGFGYTYGTTPYQNPSARTHLTEVWNGNGFIKTYGLKFPRKIICRVDTSVGDVRFTLAAGMRTTPATWSLQNADQMSVTTDAGGPANSTALAAAVATVAGGALGAGLLNGEQTSIQIDALPPVIITFQATDIGAALIVARINGFMGYACAVVNGAAVDLRGIQLGTGGRVVLTEVTAGVLAKIGHIAGTTNGTGNVANAAAVTAAELVTLIRSAAVLAIQGEAMADPVSGEVVIYRTGSASGTVRVDDVAGAMATDLGLTTGAPGLVTANIGAAFSVPAGTRVRNAGGLEWVTMRTISWPEGTVAVPNTATQDVEVRPGNDVGTLVGAVGGTVTVEVDLPTDRMVEVTNPANLSAALTEVQIDAAYQTALDATLNPEVISAEANWLLCARRSDTVVRAGRTNVIDASDFGCFGRKFISHYTLGLTMAQAIAAVANFRHDRHFMTQRGFLQTVSEIATLGAAGGTGFNDSGQITVGADGALAFLHCALNPEENIGQDTQLLTMYDGLEVSTEVYGRDAYIAFKAAGLCVPKIEKSGAIVFQSEVTTDLTVGRTTQKRRAFADYAQDTLGVALEPYSKKMGTDARRTGVMARFIQILESWKSVDNPDAARIQDYSITETTSQNPDWEALGIFAWKPKIDMFSSMDSFVLDTEIGEGVVAVSAA